jgi:hypothetical protein
MEIAVRFATHVKDHDDLNMSSVAILPDGKIVGSGRATVIIILMILLGQYSLHAKSIGKNSFQKEVLK